MSHLNTLTIAFAGKKGDQDYDDYAGIFGQAEAPRFVDNTMLIPFAVEDGFDFDCHWDFRDGRVNMQIEDILTVESDDPDMIDSLRATLAHKYTLQRLREYGQEDTRKKYSHQRNQYIQGLGVRKVIMPLSVAMIPLEEGGFTPSVIADDTRSDPSLIDRPLFDIGLSDVGADQAISDARQQDVSKNFYANKEVIVYQGELDLYLKGDVTEADLIAFIRQYSRLNELPIMKFDRTPFVMPEVMSIDEFEKRKEASSMTLDDFFKSERDPASTEYLQDRKEEEYASPKP